MYHILTSHISVTSDLWQLFFSDSDAHPWWEDMYQLPRTFNGSKKSYEFLKFVKNQPIFCHNFQILKILKKNFGPSKGSRNDPKMSLKWFLSWRKYMVSRNFLRFSTFFWAKNFENSYLRDGGWWGKNFFGNW